MVKPFAMAAFLSSADHRGMITTYRKRDVIFSQGDVADAVFYILEGECRVSIVSELGKEAVIALPKMGDFFGEECLGAQRRRITTIAASTRARILSIDKATIAGMLREEPEFSQVFVTYLLARSARVQADLVDQLFNSSEKRLARVLLLMANFGQEGVQELTIPKVDQQTLAHMVGTTRPRISHFMTKFRKLGFIEYNGRLKINSSLLNVVLHDNPALRTDAER